MLSIYNSSAGSGKTFTLVREYLALALKHPAAYRRILAVTFTNKATDEMKSRILEMLAALGYGLTDGKTAATRQALANALHLLPGEIDARAARLHTALLEDYGRFSISTIESFFQRILRALARELNIPLGYEILLSFQRAVEESVALTLVQMDETPDLADYLEGYVWEQWERGKDFRLEKELKRYAYELFRESYQELVASQTESGFNKQAVVQLRSLIRGKLADFYTAVENLARKVVQIQESFGLSPDDFLYKSRGVGAFGYQMIEQARNQLSPSEFKPSSYVRKALADESAWAPKGAPHRIRIEQAIAAGLGNAVSELVNYLDGAVLGLILYAELRKHLPALGVLADLEEGLDAYRQERQALLISDAGRLIRQSVQASDTPFLYEKLACQYQHYLMDEFQDTSDGQWKNFLPLLQHALAAGGSTLLVGDVKQSIYRWRNGNPELLLRQAAQNLEIFDQRHETLQVNYRSAPAVISFNNEVFDCIRQIFVSDHESLIGPAYADVAQQIHRSDVVGYVEARFFEKTEEAPWTEPAWRWALEQIKQLLTEGYEPGDLCILTRRNKEAVAFAEALRSEGIQVATSESLLLAAYPPLVQLTELLNLLAHSGLQPLSLLNLRKAMIQSRAENRKGLTLWPHAELAFLPEADRLRERLRKEQPELLRLPLVSLVDRLAGWLDLQPADPYLLAFLEFVQTFEARKGGSLVACMHNWEEEKEKLSLDSQGQRDAVRILTIHKSKGLEFPVVLIPEANWSNQSNFQTVWLPSATHQIAEADFPLRFPVTSAMLETPLAPEIKAEIDRNKLESINLAYVACTRAAERLYLALNASPRENESGALLKRAICTLPGYDVSAPDPGIALGKKEAPARVGRRAHSPEGLPLTLQAPLQLPMPPYERPVKAAGDRLRIRRRGGFLPVSQNRKARIDRGILMHEALAVIVTPDDLDAALDGLRLRGRLHDDELPDLRQRLESLLATPAAAPWFSGQFTTINEGEILVPDGGQARPDRILLDKANQAATVVDYKTGEPRPEHATQVQGYMSLLKQMGYSQVQGWLLYLDPLVAERVEEAV